MTDKTLGIIYLIKRENNLSLDEKMNMFLRELNNTTEHFDRVAINKNIREAVLDYLTTVDNYKEALKEFFFAPNKLHNERLESEMMIKFLWQLTLRQPTDDGKAIYINGFRDNPYSHFKAFQYEDDIC